MKYDFKNITKKSLTKPRDLCWDNWFKFEKAGDKVTGFIRDVFYRPAEAQFKEQRGITLEQEDGTLVNVGIKRLSFILNKTDDLHLGDPLSIELESERKNATKGFSPTKIFAFYGENLPENAGNPTVLQLEEADMAKGGTKTPVVADEEVAEESEADKNFNKM